MNPIESLISSLRTMHVANINLANEAADTIERQQREIESAKNFGEWISVDDDMPENHVRVLISNCDDVGHARRDHGRWLIAASNDFVSDDNVTHWMPLPEPPKPQQQDKD